MIIIYDHVETRKSDTPKPTFAAKFQRQNRTPNSPVLGFEGSAHQTRLGEFGV